MHRRHIGGEQWFSGRHCLRLVNAVWGNRHLASNRTSGIDGGAGHAAIFRTATRVERSRQRCARMIEHLIWLARNVAKFRAHGISPEEIADLVAQDTYVVDVKRECPDQVRSTGTTSAGRAGGAAAGQSGIFLM